MNADEIDAFGFEDIRQTSFRDRVGYHTCGYYLGKQINTRLEML